MNPSDHREVSAKAMSSQKKTHQVYRYLIVLEINENCDFSQCAVLATVALLATDPATTTLGADRRIYSAISKWARGQHSGQCLQNQPNTKLGFPVPFHRKRCDSLTQILHQLLGGYYFHHGGHLHLQQRRIGSRALRIQSGRQRTSWVDINHNHGILY